MIDVVSHEAIVTQIQHEPTLNKWTLQKLVQPMSAVSVKNTVIYVNRDLNTPSLKFDVGKPVDLACQVAMGERKNKPDRIIWVRPGHERSAIITANAQITDGDSTTYNYLDEKGIGNLEYIERTRKNQYHGYMKPVKSYPDRGYQDKTWGAATKTWIEKDLEMGNKLKKLNVRIVPLVAVAKIEEVVDPNGKIITIDEAKNSGYMAKETEPVVIFRAWITPYRLADVAYNPEIEIDYSEKDLERRRALQDMKNDTSIPADVRSSILDIMSYLSWLAGSIGGDLGKMHAHKMTHGSLRALHNITLDGRFVDLDSMVENSDQEKIDDERNVLFNKTEPFFKDFLSGVQKLFGLQVDPNELLKIAETAYSRSFPAN